MGNKILFYDCQGNGINEDDIFYIVTPNNTIKTFIAFKILKGADDSLCFKYFEDARDVSIKLKMELLLKIISDDMNNEFFSHKKGLSTQIKERFKSLNKLSNRLREGINSRIMI